MVNFPSTLANRESTIKSGIGRWGDEALGRLRQKGLTVGVGLTKDLAMAIGEIARQPHIMEYCPKDVTHARFGSLESTNEWLKKAGGRAVFLLLSGRDASVQLEGYGWTGLGSSRPLPDYPVTAACRIGERVKGTGASRDFVQAIVSGTNTFFAPGEGIGLETWKSNLVANTYTTIGFVLLAEACQEELRPTLDPTVASGTILDRRQYMGYSAELLG